ncbi:MAG: hypothetical protein ACLQDV_08760 [Candidatus Binataceae bacterium]
MTSIKTFKKIIPVVLAGAAAIVMAMPMTAMAADWTHHNYVSHQNLVRHENVVRHDASVRGWDNYRMAHRDYVPDYYAPQAIVPAAPAYGYGAGAYAPPYAAGGYGGGAYGGGCNEARLQNVYRRDRATGHPAAANDVAREMRNCGGMSSVAPLSRYASGQNGSVLAPLFGNFMGVR